MARLRGKTDRIQLGDEFSVRQETLRLSRKLREHERLTRDRFCLRRQCVSGEDEHEQGGARSGHAGRIAQAPSEGRDRGREIPDAVCDDEIEAVLPSGDVVHRREGQVNTAVALILAGATGRGAEHRPR